ncbi:urea ABC transporter ATP-binding subunit UrtE [Teredinibacter waterburyi]|jgi:amino acid/amide ABC transporter ATP-binding protein 2, HAAT family (TC 3.A.1.4.-)|uniref:urea ABC transporter ATP-binding subunit UrtE n=1 Tax=Teredinibacter waterburyi TaxID=1500538 RepID=UPI00165F704F|nr:urea ABC transporter ATP-binding subunit UrtE [Teredinibacter waterburyi]
MLSAKNIDLHYGASQALENVSLEAAKGEITCILGRNGVGKTSLMQAVTGRQGITSGSVEWNGRDISKLSAADRARLGIAYVPQGRQIFSQLTVLENLKTGFAALPRGERKVNDEIFDLFPVLRKMLHRRGGDLSGGQQQQLSIGRALVMKPKLLILDEPTEGIQPSIIKDIHNVISILRQQGEMAIILVEQYFEFARDLGDKYAVMDRGVVTLSGDIKSMDEQAVRKFLTV